MTYRATITETQTAETVYTTTTETVAAAWLLLADQHVTWEDEREAAGEDVQRDVFDPHRDTPGVEHRQGRTYSVLPVTRPYETTDAERFADQNPRAVADVEDHDDLATVDDYAVHHAGGQYVLWRPLEDGMHVKMHDSWADEGQVVVHIYSDRDEPERDELREFTSGREALESFLAA